MKMFNIFYNNGFITQKRTCDRRDGQLRAVIGDSIVTEGRLGTTTVRTATVEEATDVRLGSITFGTVTTEVSTEFTVVVDLATDGRRGIKDLHRKCSKCYLLKMYLICYVNGSHQKLLLKGLKFGFRNKQFIFQHFNLCGVPVLGISGITPGVIAGVILPGAVVVW